MAILAPSMAGPAAWQPVLTGNEVVAVAERDALGTSARVAIWPPGNLGIACTAVDGVLAGLDEQASRFRADSQLSWLHRAGGGLFLLGDGLAEAVGVALAAARWTGGLTDPTVGGALIALGYDRDFAAIDPDGGNTPASPVPAQGWQRVELDGRLLRLPPGIRLDLGATAKGVGCDRHAAVMSAAGQAGGVLVSLGGDIAVGGTPPRGGWPVTVADQPEEASSAGAQLVRLTGGAVATSSVTCRKWRHGDSMLHHIIEPATGLPAQGPWRTASVAAVTCADANAAATAAIIGRPASGKLAGRGQAPGPAGRPRRPRGMRRRWPAASGRPLPVTQVSYVDAGVRSPGRTGDRARRTAGPVVRLARQRAGSVVAFSAGWCWRRGPARPGPEARDDSGDGRTSSHTRAVLRRLPRAARADRDPGPYVTIGWAAAVVPSRPGTGHRDRPGCPGGRLRRCDLPPAWPGRGWATAPGARCTGWPIWPGRLRSRTWSPQAPTCGSGGLR